MIAVSDWLRLRLEAAVPGASGKTTVIDCGVDLDRFTPDDPEVARAEVGWEPEGTAFLCVGTLSERKNVLRLARAFARRGEGSLAFVGDGPLRGELEGRADVLVHGPAPHAAIPRWLAAADVVCQPSLVEPFGLATLEAMACGRSVVATRVGGPPEFVTARRRRAGRPAGRGGTRRRARRRGRAAEAERGGARGGRGARPDDRQVERIEALLERAAGAAAAADGPERAS